MDAYQKLRLQEFNQFDIERILKENVNTLSDENDQLLGFIEANGDELGGDLVTAYAEQINDNASEIIELLSLTHHIDDIYQFFSNGPLFRKDRDAK